MREVVTVSDSELDEEEDEETPGDDDDDSDDLVAVEEDEEDSWAIAKLSMSWDIVP